MSTSCSPETNCSNGAVHYSTNLPHLSFSWEEVQGTLTQYVWRSESMWHKVWTVAAVEVPHLDPLQKTISVHLPECSDLTASSCNTFRIHYYIPVETILSPDSPQPMNEPDVGTRTGHFCSSNWLSFSQISVLGWLRPSELHHDLGLSTPNPASSLFIFYRCYPQWTSYIVIFVSAAVSQKTQTNTPRQ